jgi:hypothetical protein
MRRRRWAAALTISLLAVLGALLAGCSEEPAESTLVDDPGEPIVGHADTHSVAAAWIARHYGWADAEWSDRRLVAAMQLYVAEKCDGCPVPSMWHIADGLRDFLAAQEVEGVQITEVARNVTEEDHRVEQAGFAEYAAEIEAGRPVIVTLSYDSMAADSGDYARLRELHATSFVGIGYLERGGRTYLIGHDGFEEPPSRRKVFGDWEDGRKVAEDMPGPWRETGTSLYPWDGEHVNTVMVFVRPPAEDG